MDSVTQFVLGAATQVAVLGKEQKRKALLYGGMLGTLPDLDIFIPYADPISEMTFHRGFSHSLFVLTGLALVMTLLIRKFAHNPDYSAKKLFLAIWLGLITHPLLDAFTIFGTQLFWPLNLIPASWSSVFIIDPLYTLPLLALFVGVLIKGVTKNMYRFASVALVLTSGYLGLGLASSTYNLERVKQSFADMNLEVESMKAAPLPFNIVVWRIITRTKDGDLYESVSGIFDTQAPEHLKINNRADLAEVVKDNWYFKRLNWFTGGWLVFEQIEDALVVSDLREGAPGQMPYRFILARQDKNNNWRELEIPAQIEPDYSMAENIYRLKLILTRMQGNSDYALPLKAWYQKGAASENLSHLIKVKYSDL